MNHLNGIKAFRCSVNGDRIIHNTIFLIKSVDILSECICFDFISFRFMRTIIKKCKNKNLDVHGMDQCNILLKHSVNDEMNLKDVMF